MYTCTMHTTHDRIQRNLISWCILLNSHCGKFHFPRGYSHSNSLQSSSPNSVSLALGLPFPSPSYSKGILLAIFLSIFARPDTARVCCEWHGVWDMDMGDFSFLSRSMETGDSCVLYVDVFSLFSFVFVLIEIDSRKDWFDCAAHIEWFGRRRYVCSIDRLAGGLGATERTDNTWIVGIRRIHGKFVSISFIDCTTFTYAGIIPHSTMLMHHCFVSRII